MWKTILNNLKELIIPIIVGLIIFPVKAIFDFKGIIYRDAVFNKNGNIKIRFSNRSPDDLKNVVIEVTLIDTTLFKHDFRKPIFVDREPGDESFKAATGSYIIHPGESLSRSVLIQKMDQGEFCLYSSILHKTIDKIKKGKIAFVVFRQEIENKHELVSINTRPYKFYHFIFFHPWLTSFALFGLTFLIQFIITKKPKS
jgi:hypothetical protein